jgi:hypothetical protein
LFLELEDQLNPGKLVQHAKLDGGSGIDEIHRFGVIACPGTDVPEVKASFSLLKKYSHTRYNPSHLLPSAASGLARQFHWSQEAGLTRLGELISGGGA